MACRAATSSARSSVMNLVVIARRPELAEHCAATIQALTGRHPSRTMIVGSADPDGPSWLDARVEAHCILPHAGAPETCAEMIHVTAGGESGRHLAAIVTPLLIHDLPVTVWWPDEPPFGIRSTQHLIATADRLVVDGSTWNGDGLDRLRELADLVDVEPPRRQRFRARPPISLARGDRLDLRRPGIPAVPPFAAAYRGHVRHARRHRHARLHEPGQAGVPRGVACLPTRPARQSSRWRRSSGRPSRVPGERSARPGPSRPQAGASGRRCRMGAAR